MADPAAQVFSGRLFIYPSHDIESGIREKDNGVHFDMRDYHILSLDTIDGEVTDHDVILDLKDFPWGVVNCGIRTALARMAIAPSAFR